MFLCDHRNFRCFGAQSTTMIPGRHDARGTSVERLCHPHLPHPPLLPRHLLRPGKTLWWMLHPLQFHYFHWPVRPREDVSWYISSTYMHCQSVKHPVYASIDDIITQYNYLSLPCTYYLKIVVWEWEGIAWSFRKKGDTWPKNPRRLPFPNYPTIAVRFWCWRNQQCVPLSRILVQTIQSEHVSKSSLAWICWFNGGFTDGKITIESIQSSST